MNKAALGFPTISQPHPKSATIYKMEMHQAVRQGKRAEVFAFSIRYHFLYQNSRFSGRTLLQLFRLITE